MNNCRLCGAECENLTYLVVNSKRYSGICSSCRQSIVVFHTTDNELTLNACKKNLSKMVQGRELDEEMNELITTPCGAKLDSNELYTEQRNKKSNHTNTSENVFWSSVVSVICKIYMVALILVGTIGGAIVGGIIGFLLCGVISVIVAIMTVSVLMMFVEMSKNVSKITEILSKDK